MRNLSERVQLALSKKDRQRLDRLAKRRETTISELIRTLLREEETRVGEIRS